MVAASSPKRGTSQRAVGTAGCISPRVAATDTPLSKSVSRSFGCDRETWSFEKLSRSKSDCKPLDGFGRVEKVLDF